MFVKLEKLELEQGRMEGEKRKEVRSLEERVEELESGVLAGCSSQEMQTRIEGGIEGKMVEQRKQVERLEKEKRKRSIVIKGLKVKKEEGKAEIGRLLVGIGAKVNIKGIRGVGEDNKEMPKVWVVDLEK